MSSTSATLPGDFIGELRKSGRRKGYRRVARAVYRSLKGFVEGARSLPRRGGSGDAGVQRQRLVTAGGARTRRRSALPRSSGSRLPDTGHFSALERPNEVARILRRSN